MNFKYFSRAFYAITLICGSLPIFINAESTDNEPTRKQLLLPQCVGQEALYNSINAVFVNKDEAHIPILLDLIHKNYTHVSSIHGHIITWASEHNYSIEKYVQSINPRILRRRYNSTYTLFDHILMESIKHHHNSTLGYLLSFLPSSTIASKKYNHLTLMEYAQKFSNDTASNILSPIVKAHAQRMKLYRKIKILRNIFVGGYVTIAFLIYAYLYYSLSLFPLCTPHIVGV